MTLLDTIINSSLDTLLAADNAQMEEAFELTFEDTVTMVNNGETNYEKVAIFWFKMYEAQLHLGW